MYVGESEHNRLTFASTDPSVAAIFYRYLADLLADRFRRTTSCINDDLEVRLGVH